MKTSFRPGKVEPPQMTLYINYNEPPAHLSKIPPWEREADLQDEDPVSPCNFLNQ